MAVCTKLICIILSMLSSWCNRIKCVCDHWCVHLTSRLHCNCQYNSIVSTCLAPFLTDISKHFWSFWYTCSYLCDIRVDSEEKTPQLHIFHLVAKLWTRQHRQHWNIGEGDTDTNTYNEKSSRIYIKTNRTNQSYMWFDVQAPNDHQDKSSLELSKETICIDVTILGTGKS